ncbi:tetratricopeptide repeat protein [Maribacter sp. 2304DJ31-5]|uniref:tetratricopeptide repeat protein n=1 Tax=Maribacter sp. 2304DJ31-5 TaxID=3386273 RepID=UPI0039BD3986
MGSIMVSLTASAQEEIGMEESAEVFLEEYSDAFQENFFEALKQKGIQNYDKAVNHLLLCRQLEPENEVVSHELAKAYLLDKKYSQGREYAIEALNGEPKNYWYLNTLTALLAAQRSTMEEVRDRIPWENRVLKENLATIYYKEAKYESALILLKELGGSEEVKRLREKINDSIAKNKKQKTAVNNRAIVENNGLTNLQQYKTKLENLLMTKTDVPLLLQISGEALEKYPLQPYFYYTNGYALNKGNRPKDAIEILETALDYLIDDVSLANKIYKELADAYNAILDPSKANMYLSKIKPGF